MKIQHLILGLLFFTLVGTSCEPVEPTDTTTYYVMGNGKDDASGTWMHGKNWLYKYEDNKLVDGKITFSNVPAGEWLFKVTDGTTKMQIGYKEIDSTASTPKYSEDGNNKISFIILEPSDITIAVNNKVIVLTSSVPFILQDEYEQKWPATLSIPEVGKFIKVEKAEFIMGEDNGPSLTSTPAHKVNFKKSYYMCTLEVTQEQYRTITGENPSEIQSDPLPVNNVTQGKAMDFILKLNKATGRSFRLPTEAEWEFAAMGGKLSQSYTYAGSNNVEEVAWFAGNSDDDLQAGGQKKANELGLFDMSGNVAEWCSTKSESYTAEDQVDPGVNGSPVAIRGGSFDSNNDQVRVKARNGSSSSKAYYNVGFRLLLEQPLSSELLAE